MATPVTSGLTSQVSSFKTLSRFETEIIAIYVDMMHTLGLPKSYGEIYGLLYANPVPMSFAEIHERLSLSKGSVSGGLKALRSIGAVKAVTAEDTRRERFEPELELKKLVLSYLRERIQPQLNASPPRMAELEALLTEESLDQKTQQVLKSRLDKLSLWRKKAAGLVPWVAKFLR